MTNPAGTRNITQTSQVSEESQKYQAIYEKMLKIKREKKEWKRKYEALLSQRIEEPTQQLLSPIQESEEYSNSSDPSTIVITSQ